jgi:hypothetical protein
MNMIRVSQPQATKCRGGRTMAAVVTFRSNGDDVVHSKVDPRR